MTLQLAFLSILALSVLGTSFLSGVFGMAGGMVLMGILIAILPVPAAMVLLGTAQMTANGWRAILWRSHTDFKVFGRYMVGLVAAAILFFFVGFVPDRAVVLLGLGIIPFLAVLLPSRYVPQVTNRYGAEVCGFLNICLHFIAGVSGPLLDVFFVRCRMDRRAVVATKATCQTVSHLTKLVYFSHVMEGGSNVEKSAMAIAIIMAIVGTTLSKFVLEKLSDQQFRRWTQGIVVAIGVVYLAQGVYLVATR